MHLRRGVLQKFFAFLRPELGSIRVYIFGDNEGSKAIIVDNPSIAPRSKHIGVNSILSELVRTGECRIFHEGTEEQPAYVQHILIGSAYSRQNIVLV